MNMNEFEDEYENEHGNKNKNNRKAKEMKRNESMHGSRIGMES